MLTFGRWRSAAFSWGYVFLKWLMHHSLNAFKLYNWAYSKFSHGQISSWGYCIKSWWSTLMITVSPLTHWGRVTHICVGKLTIIGSDNGLSPERRQAIIWTNAGILLIGPLGTNFSEILIEIQTSVLNKIRLKISSSKCCSFRLGLNVQTNNGYGTANCDIHRHILLEWKIYHTKHEDLEISWRDH